MIERRALLGAIGMAALAVGGLSSCASPGPTATPTPRGKAIHVPISSVPVGGGIILSDANWVVTQPTRGTFEAFSSTCQHQGCKVGSIENNDIVCLCHGSRYSIVDGSVVNGPTTRPLPPADSVTVEGSDIVIVG